MPRRLSEMTREEVREAGATDVVVIPVGSVEQHAGHLPMSTDTLLVEGVLEQACAALGDDVPLVVTPSIPVGSSAHHLFAAAMSIRPQTLLAVLHDVTESLATSGFRRLFVVNGHGGNDECIRLAVKELVLRHPVAAAACSYWALGDPAGSPRPDVMPGHAGWFETSLMLALNPGLVRTDGLRASTVEPPPVFDQRAMPGLTVQAAGEWARVDGVTDRSDDATAADGRRILDDRSGRLVDAIRLFDEQTRGLAR